MHNLGPLRLRRRHIVTGAMILGVAVTLFAVTAGGHSASTGNPVTVAGVSPATVSGDGLDITAAQTPTPATGAQAAASVASQRYGGRSVIDEQYAHCIESVYVPPVDQDCWVVALDPSGMVTSSLGSNPSQPLRYFFALIDPTTDRFIGGVGAPD